jgi:hypothetical protein
MKKLSAPLFSKKSTREKRIRSDKFPIKHYSSSFSSKHSSLQFEKKMILLSMINAIMQTLKWLW